MKNQLSDEIIVLIEKAEKIYGPIHPCSGKDWDQMIASGYFWFNDLSGSTRVIKL